jgi:drug/metabolite transporter (DMT)-like permease
MAGVLGIITKGDLAVQHALAFNNGDLLLVTGMATNGIYTALLRDRPVIHWLSFLLTLFLVRAGRVAVLDLGECVECPDGGDVVHARRHHLCRDLPKCRRLHLPHTWSRTDRRQPSGIFLHMIPSFGAALAIGLLGEPLRVFHVIGFALILCGVALASRKSG